MTIQQSIIEDLKYFKRDINKTKNKMKRDLTIVSLSAIICSGLFTYLIIILFG